MNFQDIYTELKECGKPNNVEIYKKHGAKGEVFGVSFEDLNRIKKKILSADKGINHRIAKKLWNSGNVDAKILACMTADPTKLTRNDANKWISTINYYVTADYFAELIAKTRFGLDIMYLYIQSTQEYVKRVGFSILNYFARNDEKRSDLFFSAFIHKIKQEIQTSPNRAKEGMNNCLIAIGSRNEALRDKVLEAANLIGTVEIDHGDTQCQTFAIDEYLKKVWDSKTKKV